MIAVIDVSGNNLTSLGNALKQLGYNYQLTHNAKIIKSASHVIIPGVGAAKAGMQALHDYNLAAVIKALKQPVLGICLGMQLLLDYSEEGNVECLGLIPGIAKRLPQQLGYPVPHMGWNTLEWVNNSPLKVELKDNDYVYFVHSFALLDSTDTVAYCQYNLKFSAIVKRANFYGMQFHPEKSSTVGLCLLRNFLSMQFDAANVGVLNETYSCD
ncbi:imidazole glycerol phosphate synthase subunit HisH [Legionella sp. D16C41]|uniref:imidazole glycerol phosphate synthase subunit HisH n=1 Tax=Legionella sp. D16C41 TaxID=3402688 RepID=UPI003AF7B810